MKAEQTSIAPELRRFYISGEKPFSGNLFAKEEEMISDILHGHQCLQASLPPDA